MFLSLKELQNLTNWSLNEIAKRTGISTRTLSRLKLKTVEEYKPYALLFYFLFQDFNNLKHP